MSAHGNTEWKVPREDAGLRLDKWLAADERLGSRSRALTALAKGKIFVDQAEQTSADAARKLAGGETVRLWMDRPGSSQRRYTERRSSGLHIIYEDAHLLVVNKPPGLLSVPLPARPEEPSLLDLVERHLRSHRKKSAFVVHRIDRDTSGLVLIAKSPQIQRQLREQFERREPARIYLAVVHGHISPPNGTWRDLLVWDSEDLQQRPAKGKKDAGAAKEAISHYRTVEKLPNHSLIEVRLETGKRNQIRIQASMHKHPIVGERIYIDKSEKPSGAQPIDRQALHAWRLRFNHPVEKKGLEFTVEPPADFQDLVEKSRQMAVGSSRNKDKQTF